ncbi:MAG: M3 family metallopeptidase, partial [bacterium]|nr:M3 family metallopeptidase [bacterium]
EKYDLDEDTLRPYFTLNNVRDGAFAVANKLWGISFSEIKDLPKPNPNTTAYQVKEAGGEHIGIFYVDYFQRPGKEGGAWMSSFRKQFRRNGKRIPPVITNCANFSKPVGDQPCFLSMDQAKTLFHEFGHGLHGLLSDCSYISLSGADVALDFMELPSQIMENWAFHPEVLKMYAKHYKTGESIPQELVDKIEKAGHFNQGFITGEFIAACLLDMNWHILEKVEKRDVTKFEKAALDKIGLIPEIVSRYRSTYFLHIFVTNGYAAGYYSYLWAEVLDADAFEAFKEKGIFDEKTGKAFRDNILSKGGSEDPMTLYKRFRGKEPVIKPYLERRGLTGK